MKTCFESFIREFPPSENLKKPSAETLEKYGKLVPDYLVEFWKEYGFGSYGGGLVNVADPLEYEVVEGVNTAVDIPLLTNSFGDIFLYRKVPETKAVGILNMHFRNREFFIVCEECIEEFFGKVNPDLPIIRAGLYKEAVEKFGALNSGEIFFFTPALAMGGGEDIRFVQKGNAFVHYDFLAQMLGPQFQSQY